jgi:predicted nucleic acid-binding protein
VSDFVLDASVAAEWAFEDEATDVSRRAKDLLREGRALVPGLFAFELANAVGMAVRRRRLTHSEARLFFRIVEDLRVETVSADPSAVEMYEASRAWDLTAYDAAYLSLASATGRPLATNDAQLRRAAKKAGVALV